MREKVVTRMIKNGCLNIISLQGIFTTHKIVRFKIVVLETALLCTREKTICTSVFSHQATKQAI
jgi:hypothetical protein